MSNYDAYKRRQSERESNRKKPLWGGINPDRIIQSLLCILTALLVWVGFRQADILDKQATILEKSDQTLRNTLAANKLGQRAWVAVDLKVDGPFTYSLNDGAEIKLKITISNIGHEPAFNILPAVGFLSFVSVTDDGKNFTITDRQRQLCDKALPPKDFGVDQWNPGGIGQSLLPGELRPYPAFKVRMTAEELKTFLERTTFDQVAFQIFVGGCFGYTFLNGEGGIHRTGFIYEVSKKDSPRIFRITESSTAGDRMALDPWDGFGFFAN